MSPVPYPRSLRPPRLTRRALLRSGSLFLAGASGLHPLLSAAAERRPALRFGAITDIHYADKAPHGTRHYRESLDKMADAVSRLAEYEPDFVVELGDLIDKTDTVEQEIGFLKTIDGAFARLPCERHYVLGNHCIDTLVKDEFIENCGATAPHYSFDRGGLHFVVLDACYRSDGEPYGRSNYEWTDANIPDAELTWLADDLRSAGKPTIVFAHQRLDGEGSHYVNNAETVRRVLSESGLVLAVLQGHNHRNDHRLLDGIHYATLVAMVEGSGQENSGGSLVSVFDDGAIRIDGFLLQKDHEFPAPGAVD